MITKQDILNTREAIQDDLLCLMDGLPDEAQTRACQIVVNHMTNLLEGLERSKNLKD